MSLPLNKFRWENGFNSELEDLFSMRKRDYAGGGASHSWDSYFGVADKSTGYYFEADITFSDKCKMMLKDFPPVPNHTVLSLATYLSLLKILSIILMEKKNYTDI